MFCNFDTFKDYILIFVYWLQNQFDLFLKMKKLGSGIPGSSEIQYKESDIDESMSSSSISDDVSNFKKIIMLYTF